MWPFNKDKKVQAKKKAIIHRDTSKVSKKVKKDVDKAKKNMKRL